MASGTIVSENIKLELRKEVRAGEVDSWVGLQGGAG